MRYTATLQIEVEIQQGVVVTLNFESFVTHWLEIHNPVASRSPDLLTEKKDGKTSPV